MFPSLDLNGLTALLLVKPNKKLEVIKRNMIIEIIAIFLNYLLLFITSSILLIIF